MLLLPKTLHAALARDTQHSIHSKQLHNLCQNQSALQVELSSFQSIVQTQSKSPLKSFPWKTGAIHFRFLPVRPNITSCMKTNSFALSQHVGCLLAQTQKTKQTTPWHHDCGCKQPGSSMLPCYHCLQTMLNLAKLST